MLLKKKPILVILAATAAAVILGYCVHRVIGAYPCTGNAGAVSVKTQCLNYQSVVGDKIMEEEESRFAESEAPGPAVAQAAAPRKLIRTAQVDLEVRSSEETARRINEMVNAAHGVVIRMELQRNSAGPVAGSSVFKVAPQALDSTITALRKLGKVNSEVSTGEDVTEEYVDLDARLANFMNVQKRLLQILEVKAGTVKDILAVEKELSRVGQEIECIKGRMRYVDRQVALSAVTVTFSEPSTLSPEDFSIINELKSAVRTSIKTSVRVFNGVIVLIAAAIPLLLWAAAIATLVLFIRRRINASK